MKRSYCAVLSMLLLLSAFSANSQTTLVAGDIVIIGWNATDNNINTPGNAYTDDDICFLLLRNIDANTEVLFTDFGWLSSGGFQRNEYSSTGTCSAGAGAVTDGCIRWTATSAMVAGAQIRIGVHFGLTASTGTVTSVNRSAGANGGPGLANAPQFSLSTSTDQIFAFQGSLASPTLIATVQYNGAYTVGAITICGSTASQDNNPGASVGGFNFLYTDPASRNSQYNGSKSGSIATIRTNVLNSANWTSSSISQFTFPQVTGFSVLPVHVTSFTGKNTASGHYLQWKVSNEENFSRYEVEISTDGRQYTVAGVVNAENKTDYSFTGKSILSDYQLYRLKLIDRDGKAEYSKIIRLQNTSAKDKIVVFPNPVKDVVTISSRENIIEMSIIDMLGKLCWKQKGNNNNTTALDMRSFKPGAYILTITTGSGIQAQKIFKRE